MPKGINWVIYPPLPYQPITPVAYTVAAIVGLHHDATPDASEVSIFPTPGEPPDIFICPATSSSTAGFTVQIPTFHPV